MSRLGEELVNTDAQFGKNGSRRDAWTVFSIGEPEYEDRKIRRNKQAEINMKQQSWCSQKSEMQYFIRLEFNSNVWNLNTELNPTKAEIILSESDLCCSLEGVHVGSTRTFLPCEQEPDAAS